MEQQSIETKKLIPGELRFSTIEFDEKGVNTCDIVKYKYDGNKRVYVCYTDLKDVHFDSFITRLVSLLKNFSGNVTYVIEICCAFNHLPTEQQVTRALKLKDHPTTTFSFYVGNPFVHCRPIYPILSRKYNWTDEQRKTFQDTYEQTKLSLFVFFRYCKAIRDDMNLKRYLCLFVLKKKAS